METGEKFFTIGESFGFCFLFFFFFATSQEKWIHIFCGLGSWLRKLYKLVFMFVSFCISNGNNINCDYMLNKLDNYWVSGKNCSWSRCSLLSDGNSVVKLILALNLLGKRKILVISWKSFKSFLDLFLFAKLIRKYSKPKMFFYILAQN